MKGYTLAALALSASAALAAPVAAQNAEGRSPRLNAEIRRQFEAVSASVVRLRTVADMRLDVTDPASGLRSQVKHPLEVHGTGVVVGEVEADGRTEYLILTNHHVADPSNYVVQDGASLRENRRNDRAVPVAQEETYLTLSANGEAGPRDVLLTEIARDVAGDMTMLRTVGAPAGIAHFAGEIGYRAGSLRPGGQVITSGYPHGGRKITDSGRILEVDHRHDLGLPHRDFVLSMPVEHGQSGSPVFLVRTTDTSDGPRVDFTLIGLLHARERGNSYMVPYRLWKGALEQAPGSLASRMVR